MYVCASMHGYMRLWQGEESISRKKKRLRDSPKSVREWVDKSSVARQIEVAGWEFTVDQPALLSLLPRSTGRERAETWLIPGLGTHQK